MLGRSNNSPFGAAREAVITHFSFKPKKNVKKLKTNIFSFFFLHFSICAMTSVTLYGTVYTLFTV